MRHKQLPAWHRITLLSACALGFLQSSSARTLDQETLETVQKFLQCEIHGLNKNVHAYRLGDYFEQIELQPGQVSADGVFKSWWLRDESSVKVYGEPVVQVGVSISMQQEQEFHVHSVVSGNKVCPLAAAAGKHWKLQCGAGLPGEHDSLPGLESFGLPVQGLKSAQVWSRKKDARVVMLISYFAGNDVSVVSCIFEKKAASRSEVPVRR